MTAPRTDQDIEAIRRWAETTRKLAAELNPGSSTLIWLAQVETLLASVQALREERSDLRVDVSILRGALDDQIRRTGPAESRVRELEGALALRDRPSVSGCATCGVTGWPHYDKLATGAWVCSECHAALQPWNKSCDGKVPQPDERRALAASAPGGEAP